MKKATKPILISGSIVYDRIMDYPGRFRDHILQGRHGDAGNNRVLNLSFVVDRLIASRGGTAGNIAHTVRLLGSTPLVVGAIGSDGGDYLAHLARKDISVRHIARDRTHLTASAHIITDREDNQITAFFGGVPPKATPGIPAGAPLGIISPTHIAVMKRHFRECIALGMTVIFDPGQQIHALAAADLRTMARRADIVIGNDYEMRTLRDRTGLDTPAIARGGGIAIVTRGAKGSVIHRRDDATGRPAVLDIPPCRMPARSVVDPTGAGDAYRAGFLVGLAEGRPLAVAGRMGSIAASFAIAHAGTQEHHFTRQVFWKRYTKAYGKIIK